MTKSTIPNQVGTVMKSRYVTLAFVCIIIVSITLRIWGIDYDLPYIYHPDEPVSIAIAQNMFVTGDLNPHFFGYSSLPLYINALAYIPYYAFGRMVNVFQTRSDITPLISLTMGVTKAPLPTSILLQRLVSVCFGVGTVVLTFLIARHITKKTSVALLASWMMAVSPSIVAHSRIVTPNIYVVFFAAATFSASVLIYQQGKTWHYIVAGLCAGFTISSKYIWRNDPFVAVPGAFSTLWQKITCRNKTLSCPALLWDRVPNHHTFCGVGFPSIL